MIADSKETYRGEFTIIGLGGVYTAFIAGQSIVSMSSAENCKLVIDADYPPKLKPA